MKIRTKVVLTLLSLSLLVALVGALAVNRQHAAAVIGATKEAQDVASVLGFLLTSDTTQLSTNAEIIVARLHQTQGRDVVVMDSQQLVLADAVPSEIGTIFNHDPGDEVGATIKDRKVRTFVEVSQDYPAGIKQIVVPIEGQSGQVIGAVVLEYTPLYDELMQLTRGTIRQLMWAAFGTVAIALLLAFYMGRSIARPLQQLTTAATGLASGRTDLPMPPPRRDEIGGLAAAFTHMVQKHRRAEDELRRMRDELEVRVVERTAELASANAELQAENTERKRAEEKSRESEEKFRQLADHITDVFWVRSADLRELHYVSPAFERIWGRSVASLHANPHQWADFILPEDRQRVLNDFAALTGDAASLDIEYRIVRPDGEIRWIRARGFQVLDAAHQLIRQAGIVTDITERRRTADELSQSQETLRGLNAELEERVAQRTKDVCAALHEAERANRAKSEFLSRTSHELRTPMNAILGFGQLLEMEEHLGSEPRESVEQILHAGRHLLTLIDDLLDISNADSGRMTLSLEPVSVDRLIEETLCLVRPLGTTLRIELLAPSKGGWRVLADPQRLKQVLLNLLSNAIKYNRPDGSVTVECNLVPAADPPAFRFSVKDTGPGISADKLTRLFTPFDRLDAERSGNLIVGTGLGLALSRRMVELMGGRIGVESALGEGSTFWIELPVAKGLAAPLDQVALPPIRHSPSLIHDPKTLLYIEDNASNLRLVTRILARRPAIRLLSAETGTLGLKMAREERPDLILLDLNLPDLNGDRVLERLRADPRTSGTPVVMLSADDLPGQRELMLAAGARAFLTKPVEVRILLGVLDQFLELRPEEVG
ncbi:MAG: hypothetical protein QOE70_3769 [Chthoniobacter sp.]|jgi:PAS domain S-box-containing protein|nr:hypothetical protein [Chthoniobacter sp.]